MIFLNTLPRFSNFMFNKINIDSILNKYNFNSINNIIKQKINYFYLNKFKFYLFNNYYIKNFKKIKDNIYIINKIFEGISNLTNKKVKHINIGVLNYIKKNNVYVHSNLNKNIIRKFKLKNKINFYNLGLICFPLTSTNYNSYGNYIYNIYEYIYSKSLNPYKSCLTSLFYYYNGLLFSLICLYGHDDIKVLNSNIAVIVAKLSSFVLVENSYYSSIIFNFIMSIKLINIINNSLYLCNINICNYKPHLIGLTKYTLINSGIFSKLSFQETLKTLKSIILDSKIDWKVDSKSNIILSGFIPSGSGWYRYFIN